MLSAYRPGSPATPFENYCSTGLAYFLQRGPSPLGALMADAAGVSGDAIVRVEVQPRLGDAGIADLLLTFEGGRRAIVEVQIEARADESLLPAFEAAGRDWGDPPAMVLLGLREESATPPWVGVTWLQVVEALEGHADPLAGQFAEFVLRDILGLGPVPLEQAIGTNRLYALGGAALRRRLGERVRYMNSASRPMGGHYRYLGTTFAVDDDDMRFWIGLVNETVPLGEHYHLILASKTSAVRSPAEHPRATGDWKDWVHWTGAGRVVRPITVETYDDLLGRLDLG